MLQCHTHEDVTHRLHKARASKIPDNASDAHVTPIFNLVCFSHLEAGVDMIPKRRIALSLTAGAHGWYGNPEIEDVSRISCFVVRVSCTLFVYRARSWLYRSREIEYVSRFTCLVRRETCV